MEQFFEDQENENIRNKTQQNVALLKEFLTLRNGSRVVDEIHPKELNAYIAEFIITVGKKDINEDYETSSLRSLMASFERYLKKKNYRFSIMKDASLNRHAKLYNQNKRISTTVHSASSAADYQQGQQEMSIFTGVVIHGG